MLSAAVAGVGLCARAGAQPDISGVLPVAIDQPQIHVLFQNPVSNGQGGTKPGSIVEVDDGYGDEVYDDQGFLDTGTSADLISLETQQGLDMNLATYNGQPVTYNDIALGGVDTYNVTTPYYLSTASFNVNNDVEAGNSPPDPSQYTLATGAIPMESNQQAADELVGPLDIFGMPVMEGRVTVLDMRPDNDPNALGETQSYIYNPGTAFNPGQLDTNPGIPPAQYHIKVSYANFGQFTQLNPSGAPASYAPQQYANPMIGPDPVSLFNTGHTDNTPPVSISFNGYTSTGSFLFDTGAQVSFISTAEAANLHVAYSQDGSELINTNTGAAIPNQFDVPVTGAGGGEIDALGFYLDELSLPTVEGPSINYLGAPVVIQDITVQDPNTGKTLTLDGDLGMNFFEPTADVNLDNFAAGSVNWVTFDQPDGLIGVTLYGDQTLANDLPDQTTQSASSDGDIGGPGGLSFSGGELQVTGSFSTSRQIQINSEDGQIDVAPGTTLTLNCSALGWSGGSLYVTDSGTVAFDLTQGNVSVLPDSVLNIAAGSSVVVNGTTDPFTDSSTSTYHVTVANDGNFTVNVNSSIAGIAGTGNLTIGNGTSHNTLQIAPGSMQSSMGSLSIAGGSALDITNNQLIINYGSSDPKATILEYLSRGAAGGAWNGPGIMSSTAAGTRNYGVAFADGADGVDPSLTSGEIEVGYALYGDITMQGVVDAQDFVILAAHFGKIVSGGWEDGDFFYSGTVDAQDFILLADNFGDIAKGGSETMSASDWAAIDSFAAANGLSVGDSVPEPGALGLGMLAGVLVMRRRATARVIPATEVAGPG
jgi:hypothetical protein